MKGWIAFIIGGMEKAVQKMLQKGFTPEQVAETLELPLDDIQKLSKQS